MDERVKKYWTVRAHDFGTVRKNELESDMAARWLREIESNLPCGVLDILDVGTGIGFFPVILAPHRHRLCGIDFTDVMLEEARTLAVERGIDVTYICMDAQALKFPDESFDAVISRNLTWTLPEPDKAYREWLRVLRPGGVLLNFDANYGDNIRSHSRQNCSVSEQSPYGHIGITAELERENAEITLSMPAAELCRPEWDVGILKDLGFRAVSVDPALGKRILGNLDLETAPMFLIRAVK